MAASILLAGAMAFADDALADAAAVEATPAGTAPVAPPAADGSRPGSAREADATPAAVADMPPLPATLWLGEERARGVLAPNADFSQAMPFERMSGGVGTSTAPLDRNAYSHHTDGLSFEDLQRFKLGNALFNKLWVSSPASTLASDGLGPFYNGRACESCHAKDGRGHVPQGDERAVSLVLQLANAGSEGGDPAYGVQLHTAAVPGVAAEGDVAIDTEPLERRFADGTNVTLAMPTYRVESLAYGPLDAATRLSPRLAPSVIGQGLLEAIDEQAILVRADPDDADGDGISGRPNWQTLPDGSRLLGRFGHKAGKGTVRQQTAHAFANDMGLSSPLVPGPDGDCTAAQSVCETLADGVQRHLGDEEVPGELLDLVAFYASNLAVPARRDVDDAEVLRGKALFAESGCVACHVPRHVTSRNAAQPAFRFQLVWPYTDLLLHDMGEALADASVNENTDGEANGREWRTAPLWGLGAAKTVNPRTGFLHDGRARTPLEAVLWHGGEAEASRNRVLAMEAADRDALARFLDSL